MWDQPCQQPGQWRREAGTWDRSIQPCQQQPQVSPYAWVSPLGTTMSWGFVVASTLSL